jgi:hypothetical protein
VRTRPTGTTAAMPSLTSLLFLLPHNTSCSFNPSNHQLHLPFQYEVAYQVQQLRHTHREGRNVRQRRHTVRPQLHPAPVGCACAACHSPHSINTTSYTKQKQPPKLNAPRALPYCLSITVRTDSPCLPATHTHTHTHGGPWVLRCDCNFNCLHTHSPAPSSCQGRQ